MTSTAKLPWLQVEAGALVFGQGEPGGTLLVIEEGEVALSRRFVGGEVELRTLGPGAPLGVASLHGEEPREVSARAVVDTRLVRLDPSLLMATIREQPELALRLLSSLAAQLTAADEARRPETRAASPPRSNPPTQPAAFVAQPELASSVVTALLWHSSGISFSLPDQGEVTLGRLYAGAEQGPDIDLADLAEGRSVSRLHAKLTVVGTKIQLTEDPSARNGTFVNGVRLVSGEVVELPDDARLQLGLLELRLLRC